MKKVNKLKNIRKRVWIKYVVSAILGLCSSVAYDYIEKGDCHISPLVFVRAGILFGLYLVLFYLVEVLLSKKDGSNKFLRNGKIKYLFGNKTPFWKQALTIAGIIFVMWLPYFAASYPGNMSNDTTGQLPMYFAMFDDQKEYEMQDQHPVFTTMVFGSVVYVANLIFNNMHAALAFCILLQMMVTALVFGFAIVWMKRRWRIATWLCIGIIGFLTLFPLMPLMVISLSKDTFFSWIYVLFVIALFELVRQDFRIINNKKYLVGLVLLCLLICLTKKLGVYIVSGTLVLFILFCKQQWKIRLKIAIPLVLSAGLMFIIMPIIIANTGITPTPKKEMFGLPFQQTALTYIRHGDSMAEDELTQLDKLMDLSTLKERYVPYVVDPVKGPVSDDNDFGAYIKLYIKQFFKYPDSYIDALALHVAGVFVPYQISPIFDNHWHTWNGGYFDEDFFDKPDFSRAQSIKLQEYYDWLTDTPILNLGVFSITYVVFIPAWYLICLIMRGKKKRDLLLFVPILASLVGLALSATVYDGNEAMRYLMPFVYSAPILIAYSQYLLYT
ncbi:hypothetical protein IKF84_01160 [Candidatus Saccharibacteria bacterium]|nr:hypothetical protein [Candidatus Saccharibacteria bacterium]